MRAALEPDGYGVEVTASGERVEIRIVAGPDACAECLAPEPVLKAVAADLLGVPEHRVDLTYPTPP